MMTEKEYAKERKMRTSRDREKYISLPLLAAGVGGGKKERYSRVNGRKAKFCAKDTSSHVPPYARRGFSWGRLGRSV